MNEKHLKRLIGLAVAGAPSRFFSRGLAPVDFSMRKINPSVFLPFGLAQNSREIDF